MGNNFVFSWAEDAQGKMVHVDDVPRGLACGCVCPCCREKLLARHGDIKEHGFAHHSDNRGANLDICYRVVLYKLAEQIIQTRKRFMLLLTMVFSRKRILSLLTLKLMDVTKGKISNLMLLLLQRTTNNIS